MADEKSSKTDGAVPGAAGPKPHPGYAQDVIFAGAPAPAPRADSASPSPPSPPSTNITAKIPPSPTASASADASPKSDVSNRSEIILFLSWLAGVFIIFAVGWGAILAACYAARWYHLMPVPVAGGITALFSLGILFTLERNMWLSRFMGLKLGPHSTQVTEALFFFVTGIIGLLIRSSDRPAPVVHKPHHENDGTREIVETIVFVVVLVLLLKTFLVEAFVIPTGSMADTLLGYHREFTCEKCRYRFVVNCSSEAEPQPGRSPDRIVGGVCPNCSEPNYPGAR